MKGVRHWLFTALAALSLLLTLATAAIWLRSYWIRDSFIWFDGAMDPIPYTDLRTILCAHGGLTFMHEYYEGGMLGGSIPTRHSFTHAEDAATGYPYFTFSVPCLILTQDFNLAGFEFVSRDAAYSDHSRIRSLTFPVPAILFPTLLLPALWLRHSQTLHRSRILSRCNHCGYDLRASPDRCPECGTVPEMFKHPAT